MIDTFWPSFVLPFHLSSIFPLLFSIVDSGLVWFTKFGAALVSAAKIHQPGELPAERPGLPAPPPLNDFDLAPLDQWTVPSPHEDNNEDNEDDSR